MLVLGPRQCGKTTIARLVGDSMGYAYISFDDDVARLAADADPAGFVVGLSGRAVLHEVRRVPSLFTALKQEIDRNRTPGRFLLTGSSQVLLLPSWADSLAGRLEILRLHPLSRNEMHGGIPNFLDNLFGGPSEPVAVSPMIWRSVKRRGIRQRLHATPPAARPTGIGAMLKRNWRGTSGTCPESGT